MDDLCMPTWISAAVVILMTMCAVGGALYNGQYSGASSTSLLSMLCVPVGIFIVGYLCSYSETIAWGIVALQLMSCCSISMSVSWNIFKNVTA